MKEIYFMHVTMVLTRVRLLVVELFLSAYIVCVFLFIVSHCQSS